MAWWKDQSLRFNNKFYQEATSAMLQDLDKAEILPIYFGSYQNRPSRILTTFLKSFHENIRQHQGSRLQVLFVPMDDTEKDCQDFVTTMHGNWLVVPWQSQSVRRNVRNMYNVINFPWITVVKNTPEGPIITQEGKQDIQELGEDAFQKWVELARTANTKKK